MKPYLPLLLLYTTSAIAAEPTTEELCQRAWDRAERIRVELGFRPSSDPSPTDKKEWALPGVREICQIQLSRSDDEIRALLRDFLKMCGGGDCR